MWRDLGSKFLNEGFSSEIGVVWTSWNNQIFLDQLKQSKLTRMANDDNHQQRYGSWSRSSSSADEQDNNDDLGNWVGLAGNNFEEGKTKPCCQEGLLEKSTWWCHHFAWKIVHRLENENNSGGTFTDQQFNNILCCDTVSTEVVRSSGNRSEKLGFAIAKRLRNASTNDGD